MKKIIATILLCFVFALSLSVTALAAEGEETDTPTTENAADGENGGSVTAPDGEAEDVNGTLPEGNTDTDNSEDAEHFYSGWIDSITSSSLWVSIGSYLLTAIAIIGFVAKKLGNINELIRGKADKATITAEIKSGVKEMRAAFDDEYQKINSELMAHKEKEKQMWAMLTIFMTHCKIPAAAKAEIMNCITGIKDMSGDLKEIVEAAEEAICAAEKEEAENAPATPALDAVLAAAKEDTAAPEVMELG